MTMEDTKEAGSLHEESIKRKERLKALKRKVDNTDGHEKKDSPCKAASLPKPKFRSYKPSDSELKELVIDAAKPGDVEAQVKSQLEATSQRDVIQTLDVSNLAPRKPDWDLKRDAAKKLEKLERRTQRAIAELIRDRLRSEAGDDLAIRVALGAEAEQQAAEGEE